MKPYQQRVVDEKSELDAKLAKLKEFFGTDLYVSLDRDEQRRLSHQHTVMTMYSDVLGMRIAVFHQPETDGASMTSSAGSVDAIDSDDIVASCNCLTKTPKVQFHKKGCKYRLICERNNLAMQVSQLKESLQDIADMPQIDQDDEYRLRYKAQKALNQVFPESSRPAPYCPPAAATAATTAPDPDPRPDTSITRSEPGD